MVELPGLSGEGRGTVSIQDSLLFASKGGHSLGRAVNVLLAQLENSSTAPAHRVTWSCRAVGPREWCRHEGLGDWLAPAVTPAMCFPSAAHSPGGGSRRALPHVSWPCVSTTACLCCGLGRPRRGGLDGAFGGWGCECDVKLGRKRSTLRPKGVFRGKRWRLMDCGGGRARG